MNSKLFSDALSGETLVKLTDEMLRQENISKNKSKLKTLQTALRIVPAVAAIVLVIGLVNTLPQILNGENENADNKNKIIFNPGLNGDLNAYMHIQGNTAETNDTSVPNATVPENFELFLPTAIEKTFFDNEILSRIADKKAANKLLAYYLLKDPYRPDATVGERQKTLATYPFTEAGAFYVLDPNISNNEKDKLLGYISKYTDLTGNDMYQMSMDYGVPLPIGVDPAYSNVRFGDTENILLLDVEWYDYDTFNKEIVEYWRTGIDEIMKSEDYMNLSDKDKNGFEKYIQKNRDEGLKQSEKNLIDIKDKKLYVTRTINGKTGASFSIGFDKPTDISQIPYINSDGYYMWEVYPYYPGVSYYDENGDLQFKSFDVAKTKSDFKRILREQIKPYCDDLLAKGLISQAEYDIYTKDPLQRYIDEFFN